MARTIEEVKQKEGSLDIVYVQGVHMANGEVICEGKTILIVNDENKKYVFKEVE